MARGVTRQGAGQLLADTKITECGCQSDFRYDGLALVLGGTPQTANRLSAKSSTTISSPDVEMPVSFTRPHAQKT